MLILDDHETTRRILRRIFTLKGWDVAESSTVAEALALLESEEGFDWVISDLMLPDGDGEVVLRKIRADGLKTRVMICTATYDPARMDAMAGLFPDAVFQKPLDIVAMCQATEPDSVAP